MEWENVVKPPQCKRNDVYNFNKINLTNLEICSDAYVMAKIRFIASEASSKNQWAVKRRNYVTLQIFKKKLFRRRLTLPSSSRSDLQKRLTFDSYITVSCGLKTHFEYHTSLVKNKIFSTHFYSFVLCR